jgi:hypothetical protein
MKVNLKALGSFLFAFVKAAYPAVAQVEEGVLGLAHAKGKEKQQAALQLILASIAATEQVLDQDLVDDPEVKAAGEALIDAVVHFQNVLAHKASLV